MSDKPENPPAFPYRQFAHVCETDEEGKTKVIPVPASDAPGMTLRDYFAAAALRGMAGCREWLICPDGLTCGEHLATEAYACADAMLAERSKS